MNPSARATAESGRDHMTPTTERIATHVFVVKVGGESLSVYGSIAAGWIVGPLDGDTTAAPFRYRTLDELMFALINLSSTADGNA